MRLLFKLYEEKTVAESLAIKKKENFIGKKSVKWKNMALLLPSFFLNSLVQNIIIYLVDIWHYAIY